MASYLYLRDVGEIVDEVKSAPETFTSWDRCMEKTYCKWPAIVGIVVGSLILLSVIWCFARCLCCGAQLCSCCCGSCCPSGGRKNASKHKDDYTRMPPTPYSGYQPTPSPMAYGQSAGPQFATFDDPSSKKINEDSLPPMPSWDTATKRRVEDTSEPPQTANDDLEMGRLDVKPQTMRGGYNSVPNAPMSPISPNPHAGYFVNDGSMNHVQGGDLGTQRMGPAPGNYDQFQAVPLSPPPTYRSHSMAGVANHTTGDYARSQQHQPSYQQQSAFAPPMGNHYEPSHMEYGSHAVTVPSQYDNSPSQPDYHQPQQYQPRPPSFLQVGRKPAPSNFRDV